MHPIEQPAAEEDPHREKGDAPEKDIDQQGHGEGKGQMHQKQAAVFRVGQRIGIGRAVPLRKAQAILLHRLPEMEKTDDTRSDHGRCRDQRRGDPPAAGQQEDQGQVHEDIQQAVQQARILAHGGQDGAAESAAPQEAADQLRDEGKGEFSVFFHHTAPLNPRPPARKPRRSPRAGALWASARRRDGRPPPAPG